MGQANIIIDGRNFIPIAVDHNNKCEGCAGNDNGDGKLLCYRLPKCGYNFSPSMEIIIFKEVEKLN